MSRKFLNLLSVLVIVSVFLPVVTRAQEPQEQNVPVTIHVFKRESCTHCQDEKEFLMNLSAKSSGVPFTVEYHDIVTNEADNSLYQQITTLKRVARITPITVVGDTMILGFDAPETTGVRIQQAVMRAHEVGELSLSDFIAGKTIVDGTVGAGCESGDVCTPDFAVSEFSFKLPFLGVVDLQTLSLTSLAIVLGTVDGFNPCAMWVLVTFLLVLMQVGNRRRMFQIAGLFILAEAAMYALILNVWYSAWDFVGLDQIVTPIIGVLAIGGGVYFLYKYHRDRKAALVCDVTDLETQGKIQSRIQEIAKAPLTIAAIGAVIAIAFSVNIIEFACSVGIPQAFTKILELNHLSFWGTQGYTLMYIFFYMIDDFVVFGLALWGIDKLHSAQKYSHASLLIGGILMIILGGLLSFAPNLLTL